MATVAVTRPVMAATMPMGIWKTSGGDQPDPGGSTMDVTVGTKLAS